MNADTKTLVTLLLDRSGSMQSIRDDTVGAVNAWLSELRKTESEMRFSLVMFDTHHHGMDLQKVHVAVPIRDVPDLAEDLYEPRGMTPLIDAACTTIRAVRKSLADRDDEVKVVFAIQTDGFENASRENQWKDLRALVTECEAQNWQFNFMGCGIDAYDQAARMGIERDRTLAYKRIRKDAMESFDQTAKNIRGYAEGRVQASSYSLKQKLRSGDDYDPRIRKAREARMQTKPDRLDGLGWDGAQESEKKGKLRRFLSEGR